ncbi:signaling protein, partial [Escherichia coli]|nr:signaling protein [Escherichia coli]
QAAAAGRPPAPAANPVTAPARTAGGPPAPTAAPPQATVAGILQRFDATPVSGGYRIGDNGPPGMVAGDVIQSVNGTALSDPI